MIEYAAQMQRRRVETDQLREQPPPSSQNKKTMGWTYVHRKTYDTVKEGSERKQKAVVRVLGIAQEYKAYKQ